LRGTGIAKELLTISWKIENKDAVIA
jgi:hypothetical protein